MKRTLKNTLIVSYSVIALLIVLALSLLFNFTADKIFEQYAKKQQKNQIEQIMTQIDQLYDPKSGLYDMEGLELIGYAALQNGIIIHVQTTNREIDWDIKSHRAEECKMVLQHAENIMHKKYPNFKGSYLEDTYTLKNEGAVTGTLKIGYYGPYSLNDDELELLRDLNKSLVFIGGAALFIVIVLGVVIARAVSEPITNVIDVAQRIAGGEYGVQAEKRSPVVETDKMIESINEMSKALEMEEKQKRQITSDVAHELRTPLTNLQSHMEAMIDGVWEATTDRLESCHGEILRLVGIVEQLKELYDLENRKQTLDKSKFEFRDLCKSVFSDFEIKAKEEQINLFMIMPEATQVYADFYRLKQCMVNLISNALAYTPMGGHISVEYRSRGKQIQIIVSDSGIGIPEEELPHLFDRFYRVDKSRSKKTGGMGIGLSITKAIIENHGGNIFAESQKGLGTVFTIILPQ
ncbi:HAMP domain-containing sensor histidine kinase [Lachnospiraceae bacterium 54-53]